MTTSQITGPQVPSSATYLTESELAVRWQVARGSLANLRSAGKPVVPWHRIMGRVRYDITDVIAYEQAGRQVV